MNKYLAALLSSLLGFCLLTGVGYAILSPAAGGPGLIPSDDHKIVLFIFGTTLWSICQIGAVLCLIGFTPTLPRATSRENKLFFRRVS